MSKILIGFLIFFVSFKSYGQNSWLHVGSYLSYATGGDLDVNGTQITVESIFQETPNNPRHDLVSKHSHKTDVNYLLRADHCELTTSNGFFKTNIVSFNPNQCYHVAFTYNGQILKFYQNGCLVDSVPASGTIVTNNFPLTLGQIADPSEHMLVEQYTGYIDEVRVWNVCRSQKQIALNMTNLLNPGSQTGLLAYYNFTNLNNLQGNSLYNLSLFGTTSIQNSNCSLINIQPANLISNSPLCIGDNLFISASNVSSGGNWYGPFGYLGSGASISINNVNYSDSGLYYIIVNYYNCISDTEYINIEVGTSKNIVIDTTICQGDTVLFNNIKYFDQGNYRDTIFSLYGCDSIIKINIKVIDQKKLKILGDSLICEGRSTILQISEGEMGWWSNGVFDSLISVNTEGQYYSIIKNKCYIDTVYFYVKTKNCDCKIFVPNVFTPNGDGLNETFFPVISCELDEYHLFIFNRWGNLLYKTSDQYAAWDGKYRGKNVPDGVYFYLLDYVHLPTSTKKNEKRGSITILR